MISGWGSAVVEGSEQCLEAGSLLLVEAGEGHEIECCGERPLETLSPATGESALKIDAVTTGSTSKNGAQVRLLYAARF